MRRFWEWLTGPRLRWAWLVLALAGALALCWWVAPVLALAAGVGLAGVCLGWWGRRALRRWRGRRLADAVAPASGAAADVAALRHDLLTALDTIRTSRLGLARGAAALYELPWYVVIGHPSAGKSSAITQSGLQFPLAGAHGRQGVGGTRHCDWFFTTEGILLDTAGRYAVEERDRQAWFGFLGLLRKHRRRAPLNGIIIAASVADLVAGPPQKNLELARHLRTRVQELTERLHVHAPVYVLFTKIDLVGGFLDLFRDADPAERDRIWGATLRFNRRRAPQDVLAFFDARFDELQHGVHELSLATMGCDPAARAGVFTFPVEFAALKPALRGFLATLFEENTWQFRPVFRGFYFTSALQEGEAEQGASRRIAERFGLSLPEPPAAAAGASQGYFLRDLFRQVIFADRELVARYQSPARRRLKLAGFACTALLTGMLLAGWSWAYVQNRELVAVVRADLAQAAHIQQGRADLPPRLEALDLLQARIGQLERFRGSAPAWLSLGLAQDRALERKLLDEYFAGMREVLLQPAAAALEAALAEANAHAADLTSANAGDTYNALKAYLMLADKRHVEPGQLGDQLTRVWRGWLDAHRGAMPRERMVAIAERLLSFHLAHVDDPAWPELEPSVALLDTTRENLRRVVRAASARERVYADIKGRASLRYPAVAVARLQGGDAPLTGSHAVPGAFTRAAWDGYVREAIRDAAGKSLQSTDWVLRTATHDDLSLEGSPDQIRAALTDMYKADYIQAWSAFLQGVAVAPSATLDDGVKALDRLADVHSSPLALVLKTAGAETAWDGPGGGNAAAAQAQRGIVQWFREVILRRTPAPLQESAGALSASAGTEGRIAREFSGLAKLVTVRDKEAAPLLSYLDGLARLRARLQQIRNQADPGPGARQLMLQTLDGSGSELADSLKAVDEQLLAGLPEAQRQVLRPALVRPLMQAFALVIPPAEAEVNKVWTAQVVEPFRRTLAAKYPFDPSARIEAQGTEIGQVFGPDGAVARFVGATLGPLVIRRGDLLAPRQWGELGLSLAPEAVAGFPGWVAPLGANGVAAGSGPRSVFQLLPSVAPGVQEYTIEIDGQQLRYRNGTPAWVSMVHPGAGVPGARISAVASDGRTVELFNEPGEQGLKKMIDTAAKARKDANVHELRWSAGNVTVAVELRIASSTEGAPDSRRGFVGMQLPETFAGKSPVRGTVASAGGAQ